MADGNETTSIKWHPAFCSAAEFDLRANRASLTFEPEHNLGKEPLRMDLLIIKKQKDEVIENDIARIFRKYNVIEYKSPDDALTIDDFYKTIGYACIYKAMAQTVNEIPADELTVSVFRETRPEKLLEMLTSSGAVIRQTAPGVYAMPDMKPFPAQIVVTKELDSGKHAGLKMLSRNTTETDIEEFLLQAEQEQLQGDRINIDSILDASYNANKQAFDDYKRRKQLMGDALRFLMKEELEAAEKAGMEAGMEAGRKAGIEVGMEAGRKAGRKEAALETSREMAINMNKIGISLEDISKVAGVSMDVVRTWLSKQTA